MNEKSIQLKSKQFRKKKNILNFNFFTFLQNLFIDVDSIFTNKI